MGDSSLDNIEEILEGEFDLDIPNFTKFNPGKTSGWIRLNNDWFMDPAIHRLTATERYLWVTLLSLRGNKQKPLGNLCATSLQRIVNIPGRSIKASLRNLCKQGLISLRTNERTNELPSEKPKKAAAPVPPAKPAGKLVTGGVLVWEEYKAGFYRTYKTEPFRNSKTNTQCKRLSESAGVEQAVAITRHYFVFEDDWVRKTKHPLDWLVKNYHQVHIDLEKRRRAEAQQRALSEESQFVDPITAATGGLL